ncbi:MAG: SDR family oxidoreductase [Oscillospiraceae bacterium]|nr:SDR family oxidoreductase [Oscillospiraceae bacterium]
MSNYVITGANSEIGRALAQFLLAKNHEVLLVSRSAKSVADSTVKWIDGVDLTKECDLLRLREYIRKCFSTPFTLIHSVGDFWAHKSVTNTSFDEVVSQIQSHYVTLFGVVKAVVPIMQAVGGGRIIAFSCNSVRYNYPDMAAFTSSKAAVECLIKCVANEQSKYNITANAFALPSIKTNNVLETKPEAFHKNYPTLSELSETVEQTIENLSPLVNGNVISLFKYSDSFYHKGYYERNIIWEANQDERVGGLL